jgi:hypothetical protein
MQVLNKLLKHFKTIKVPGHPADARFRARARVDDRIQKANRARAHLSVAVQFPVQDHHRLHGQRYLGECDREESKTKYY